MCTARIKAKEEWTDSPNRRCERVTKEISLKSLLTVKGVELDWLEDMPDKEFYHKGKIPKDAFKEGQIAMEQAGASHWSGKGPRLFIKECIGSCSVGSMDFL
jgi:hypothetical protein